MERAHRYTSGRNRLIRAAALLGLAAGGPVLRAAPDPAAPLLNNRTVAFAWVGEDAEAVFIDVYQTRDGDRWEKVHSQEAASPRIAVTVSEDGWYGFSVVARGADGRGEDPPAPGEPPEIQAFVDTRGPEILEMGPPTGSSWDAERPMPISWRARDESGVREVLIEYHQEGGEGWRPVRRESAAAGEWLWVVPNLMRRRFEVRLTAVDAAGNRSAPETRSYRLRTPPAAVDVTLRGPRETRERDVMLAVEIAEEDWDALAGVEVWQTVDNGKSWKKREEMFRPDARTLAIRLEETGRYGFFVRPVPKGDVELTALETGVLPHLECWARFPPPMVRIEPQPPPSPAARERARRHYLSAQAALARRDAAAAQEAFEACLEIWPDFAPALNDLACLHMEARRFDEAQMLFARAAGLFPEDPDYRFNLGACLLAQGRPLEALGHLEKAAEAATDRPSEAMILLADCLWELEDAERALSICRGLLERGEPARIAVEAQRRVAAWEKKIKR